MSTQQHHGLIIERVERQPEPGSDDEKILLEAYDWMFTDDDGFAWGLTAGDHGHEETCVKIPTLAGYGGVRDTEFPFPGGGVVGSVEARQLKGCCAELLHDERFRKQVITLMPDNNDWLWIIRRADTEGET